jgi:hypothetical protein
MYRHGRLADESNNVHVWEALFDKACEIASEFEMEASRPRVVVRQRNRANYSVDNPSDWRISIFEQSTSIIYFRCQV